MKHFLLTKYFENGHPQYGTVPRSMYSLNLWLSFCSFYFSVILSLY